MAASRLTLLIAAGALVATGITVAPAFGASDAAVQPLATRHAPAPSMGMGSFTPAAADPRLAAMFARSGVADDGFSFTPAQTRRVSRAVTVAVRARSTRSLASNDHVVPNVGLTPIAYNLGAAVGWKRFAVVGDVAHVDLQGQPGSREAADLGVSYTLNRFTGRVKGLLDRPLADAPKLVEQAPSYSVDVGGAYRLAHNVDLTAGVRYRMDIDRLQQSDDVAQHHDSQAVYVGTAFRF
ncbi:MAG: hypothetical protein ACRYFW_09265 [Janthinobacterium lividum]